LLSKLNKNSSSWGMDKLVGRGVEDSWRSEGFSQEKKGDWPNKQFFIHQGMLGDGMCQKNPVFELQLGILDIVDGKKERMLENKGGKIMVYGKDKRKRR